MVEVEAGEEESLEESAVEGKGDEVSVQNERKEEGKRGMERRKGEREDAS